MGFDWALVLSLLLTAFAAAAGAVFLLAVITPRATSAKASVFSGPEAPATLFVFDGEVLIDASPSGRALLAAAPFRGSAWQRLMGFLESRFPQIGERLAHLDVEGRVALNGTQSDGERPLFLLAEWHSGLARITLSDPDAEGMTNLADPLTLRAMEEELRLLRGTVSQAPLPIWLENDAGEVIWANTGYLALARSLLGPEQDFSWPLPRLMKRKGDERQRVRAGGSNWYDLHVRPADGGAMVFALPIDALVEAESQLRDFTQTLTKTFAHLPIGLAVFDRQRELVLFNPALLDLTGLPADFLSSRPLLFHVLDRMRDRQMIPEPKDYAEWRQKIIDLEKQVAAGLYMETWTLPGGQTYRVIARPHPDGALAMLFEDISTEMTRTRRFRADLELGQSVVDAMEEAIAVFSPAGSLVMSNLAYSLLWLHDPAGSAGVESGIGALAAYWRIRSAPSTIWAEAENFVAGQGQREPWEGEVRLNDGRLLACRVAPLSGGATMIAFRVVQSDDTLVLAPQFQRARIAQG